MSVEIKRMDIKEFRTSGFLQEANRLFFHPLGLALEVVVYGDGSEKLGGVWDYREDEEGMLYPDGMVDGAKVAYVETLYDQKASVRRERYGYVVQPASKHKS